MLEDIMPGEVVLSRVSQGNLMPSEKMDDPDRKLQEMAEKLEKSEAGRKKLRQAIAMLKEKMEATEKVLQVNETLRQECEKERLRAETESKKAEEEKALRVQIEGENLSVKEQLVGVLQRLHAVERNAKSDREETLKLRGEMKQAVSALGGALHVAEAAQSSLEGLEKLVQDKVNNAVSSSTRALSMAQSVTSDVKAAQGVAASAEKVSESLLSRFATVQKQSAELDQRVTLLQQETSKALSLARSVSSDAKGAQVAAASAEKTSQSLVSRIAAVQKQSAGLDQRVNVLQQELRTRIVDVGATPSGARTANGVVPCGNKNVSNKGMVLSKSQQPIVSSAKNLKPPYRSSVVGSSDFTRGIGQKETVAGLSGLCVQPKSHLEAIPLVDSGSSADCVSTVSRELELSFRNKVSNSTRGPSGGNITNRKLTASSPVSAAAPRVPKPADTPTKCAPYHGDVEITSEPANEAVGRVNVDSCSGSFPASGEPGEKRLGNTNISIPHISSVTRRKVSSKKCSATGPINSDFCDRQRVCGAVNTAEDKRHTLPLRVTDAEKGSKALDVGEDKVLKGQRKVKLPAALLKDITKLFNKEKKVQVRMEAKLMALEQVLQSGGASGTIAEQLSAQVTRKRKRKEKMSDSKSKEEINGDSHQKSRNKSRTDTAPLVGQAVEDCSGSSGKRAGRNGSKDPVTGDPSTPVQSTPPFALPQVSESVVAEISGAAKRPEQPGKEDSEYASRAVSSVSDPSDGGKCNGLGTQLRKGLENGEENISKGLNWCRYIPGDNEEMNEWSATCSSGLLERARTRGNDREHTDMDIDRSSHKPIHEMPEGIGHGWETESEISDDDFDPEWWTTERVLLSPTLPQLQRWTAPQITPLDPGVADPEPKEMSLEDLAFFLDVLPPITGEGCEEEIKDVQLQLLPDTETLEESLSDNIMSGVSISPKFQDAEKVDEEKATQKQENWSNSGGPRICRSPLPSGSAPTSVGDTKITGEDPRKEDDTGNVSTNVFEVKLVSDDKLVSTGGLTVLGQSQTCIVTSAVDSREADGSLGEEDEQIMVRDSVPSRGLILVTGVVTDKALPTHEANAVPTPRSPANIQKSLNYESGDEAGVQEECRALIPTVGNKLENAGVDGSLGKAAGGNRYRDSVASRCPVQVTGTQPSSNSAVPPLESNIVPITGTPMKVQRSLDCQSGEEGRGVQETESTAKIEDVYPEPNCEGEAKSKPPYGLKLLAGFLGENKPLDFPDSSKRSRQQMPWRIREIASVVGKTRDCLVHALKHHSTCEVKSWTASNDLASSLEKTRLSGMNLLSIFTASLIDAYAWWESETSARAPAQCRFIEFLFLLVNEVFEAELFRRVLSPDFQVVDIFADQLQEFLIQGSVRPIPLPEVENTSCDHGEEITFQIRSATSDLKRTRIVTSASKLLASLCLGGGKTEQLRKTMYLMLRYSYMDSSWLLAANSSFATVFGRQLYSVGAGDFAGQAVRVVISELLNDAEGTLAPGNGIFVTDSPAGNVDESREEEHEQSSDAVISIGEVLDDKISSTNFLAFRDSVGKFENDLNFEAFLPKILHLFLTVISSKELLESPYISPDSAYRELHEQSGRPLGASKVPSEWAANTVDGAPLQPCQKVDLEEIDACCWLCGYSTNSSFRSTFAKTMGPGTKSGDPCIAWGQKFHGVTHALELIACHLGWEWTYNDLIAEHLGKCVYPGASDTTVAFVARSIGIFGRLGIEADGTELQGVEELRRILTAILRSGHKVAGVYGGTCAFSFTAQVAAAQSLVNLSRDVKKDTGNTPGPISDSQASLLAWFQALDPTSRESLPLSLRSLQSNFGG